MIDLRIRSVPQRFEVLFENALRATHGEPFLSPLEDLLNKAGLHTSTALVHERVVGFSPNRLRLKATTNGLTLASIPKTTLTEKIEKLSRANGSRWPKVYVETPLGAIHHLRQVAALPPERMPFEDIKWQYRPEYDLFIPDQRDLRITIEKCLLVTSILSTKSTFDRDELLGFFLRIWQGRITVSPVTRNKVVDGATAIAQWSRSKNPSRPTRRHKDAWRLIEEINRFYSCVYRAIGEPVPNHGLLSVPDGERIREEIFEFSSRHEYRSESTITDPLNRITAALQQYKPS